MRIIDIAIPQSEPNNTPTRPALPSTRATGFRSQNVIPEYILDEEESVLGEGAGDASADDVDEGEKFYDAADATTEVSRSQHAAGNPLT